MPNAGDYVRAGDTTRYFCKATQSVAQSIANNGTTQALTFDAADDVDNLGIHDPVTLNTRFVIGLKLGWWEVSGIVWFATATTATRRGMGVGLNGTGIAGGWNIGWAANGTAAGSASVPPVLVQATTSTDYVELFAYQDSGGAILTSVATPFRPSATLLYIGS